PIVPLAPLEIAAISVNGAQSPVTAAVASVEVDRRRGERQGLIQYGVGGIIVVDKYICEGVVRAGQRIVGIEIDSLLKQFGSARVVVGVVAAQMLDAAQDAFIGGQRRLAPALLEERLLDATVDRRDDGTRHLIRNSQDVGQGAVICFTPDLRPAAGIDEPYGESQSLAHALQAALREVGHAKPPTGLADIAALLRRCTRRIAIEAEQRRKAPDTDNEVFGDPVAEMSEIGIPAEIAEGQHGDRWPIGRSCSLRPA